jgi:integrase/recombinase XerD
MSDKIRALPPSEWPDADRNAWRKACDVPERVRPGGAAARLKPSTRTSLTRAYGYLLEFCRRKELIHQHCAAAGNVTPEAIQAFLSELCHRVGSVTRMMYISKIRAMAAMLAPERDLSWLADIEADLRYEARPRPKYHRIVPTERLVRLGLDLISRGEKSERLTPLTRARLVRDGLMVALLAFCPIRLGNFARLRLGKQVRLIGECWWITLQAPETKSGRPDDRAIPPILTDAMHRWVRVWRAVFHPSDDALWPSIKGGALAYSYVGHILTETTRRELGVAINPHLFRDCGVYTVATRAGDSMGIASALLQHTDARTTEKHYNKGAMLTAAAHYQRIVDELT